jgi:hypothetical protein
VLALSAEDVEVGGPRGSGRGHQLVREWLARTGIELKEMSVFGRGETIVVEQRAAWRDADRKVSSEREIATVFVIRDGKIARLVRYDSVEEALRATALDRGDLIEAAEP